MMDSKFHPKNDKWKTEVYINKYKLDNSFPGFNFVIRIKMDAYVAMDGYTLPSGYIMKELCIIFPNGEYDHFLFSKPDLHLNTSDIRTIRYTTKYLNNLNFNDGSTPYTLIEKILSKIQEFNIYTYSDVAQKTLQKYLPTTVIVNIQDIGFRMPNTLPKSACFREHNTRYCAKSKAIAIQTFMLWINILVNISWMYNLFLCFEIFVSIVQFKQIKLKIIK